MRLHLSIVILGLASALPAAAGEPPKEIAPWLGQENTVVSNGSEDHIPAKGKLTLIYDAKEDVVRVCTRITATQGPGWREEMAQPCEVKLNFMKGERYCKFEEVKAGNAEALVSCHRLRNTSVAMHPSGNEQEAVERHDVTFYLIEATEKLPRSAAITLDSPSALTHFGAVHVHP